jgi:hypothetical protein
MQAILLYIDDWLSSQRIAEMDAHEERGYLRLLLRAATEDDCGLPDDDKQLAIASKLGPQWFKPTREKEFRFGSLTSGQKVRQCFFADPEKPGRIFNARLLREFEYQKTVHASRKGAASAAAKARWDKLRKPSETDAPRMPDAVRDAVVTECVRDANQVWVYGLGLSSADLERKEPSDRWSLYWGLFVASGKALNRRDEERACRQFLSLQGDAQVFAVMDAGQNFSNGTWPNPELTPFPNNHLTSEPWTRVAAQRTLPPTEPRGPVSPRDVVERAKAMAREKEAKVNGKHG